MEDNIKLCRESMEEYFNTKTKEEVEQDLIEAGFKMENGGRACEIELFEIVPSNFIEIINEWQTCDCGWSQNTEDQELEACPYCHVDVDDMTIEYQMYCNECGEYWMSNTDSVYICEHCGAE